MSTQPEGEHKLDKEPLAWGNVEKRLASDHPRQGLGVFFKSCQPDDVMSQDIEDSRTYVSVGPAFLLPGYGPGGCPVG